MKPRPRPHLIPGIAAAAALAVASAATLWSAQPLYGPMVAEFGWQRLPLELAAAVSVVLTAALSWPAALLALHTGTRATALSGCLASGLILLLVLPNLTHFWQLLAVLACLGGSRALILGGAWRQLRRSLRAPGAGAAIALCAAVGAAMLTPWIAQIVYRNSWREGAAACGGLLLVVAAPAVYLLLPGREAACHA